MTCRGLNAPRTHLPHTAAIRWAGSRVRHFAAHMPPEMQPPASTLGQKIITISAFVLVKGGSGGIRTPGTSRYARFQVAGEACAGMCPRLPTCGITCDLSGSA
jgi:hypothetical protein